MEWIYFMRSTVNGHQRPSVTVVLMSDGRVYHRGMAICSVKENPKLSTGVNKARGKSMKAWKHKADVEPIKRTEALKVLNNSWPQDHSMTAAFLAASYNRWFKGAYDVELTPFEKRMVSGKEG